LIKAEKLNAELMLRVNLLREYGLENFELKELLKYKDKTKFPLETVKVISRLTSRTEGNLIINKGIKDSLTSGMAVINNDGLVGIVTDVSNSFSMVRTINNTDLKITVTDQRSGVNAIAGWDGEKMLLRNVPTTYDIEPGDRIVTSELSTVYPPSIPVGIVTEKESNISGLLGNVVVKPFAHANKAGYLFVIKIVRSREVDSLEMNLFIEKK
jgi:rod shape-determining protein MreC